MRNKKEVPNTQVSLVHGASNIADTPIAHGETMADSGDNRLPTLHPPAIADSLPRPAAPSKENGKRTRQSRRR